MKKEWELLLEGLLLTDILLGQEHGLYYEFSNFSTSVVIMFLA